jgi:acetoin utilization deacetylase AcuC-like enzyme
VCVSINWASSLYHARKSETSGFCDAPDCVIGILELLERYDRVMCIAFTTTSRRRSTQPTAGATIR